MGWERKTTEERDGKEGERRESGNRGREEEGEN